jgi:hypothetical protein
MAAALHPSQRRATLLTNPFAGGFMYRFHAPLLVAVLLLGSACGREDAAVQDDTGTPGMAADHDMHGMHHDGADMQRMAEEGDSLAAAARASAAELRDLAPPQAAARMADHTAIVDGLVAHMERHLQEMEGMHDDDAQHATVRRQAGELRDDAAQLRAASPDQVRQLLPQHLERLDAFIAHVERSSQHMRSGMHGMQHDGSPDDL